MKNYWGKPEIEKKKEGKYAWTWNFVWMDVTNLLIAIQGILRSRYEYLMR